MVQKSFLLLALVFIGINVSLAQSSAGVNTSSPSPKAALDIKTTTGFSQGLFIPRLKTVDRPAFNPLTDTESGLMFYDTDKDSIFYWTGTNWVSLMVNKAVAGTPVTGAGTLNSVARWTSASDLGTGILKDNGSSVFIGAQTGTSLLNVNAANPGGITINNTNALVAMALVTGYSDLKNKFEFTHDLYFSPVTYNNIGVGADPANYVVIKNNGNVGIGIAPLANLTVAGTGTQAVHIGDVFSSASAGITLNGTISDGTYNMLSNSTDKNLYLNRPTGSIIEFRENNVTSLTLNPTGTNTARVAHMNLTSANTWGTSINIANTSSGGSTYTIASTGASHPLGRGSFVVQDLSSNYAFVLNSLTGDTHISCVDETVTPGKNVGIGFANPNSDLGGTEKLQVNGMVLAKKYNTSSDKRYKKNIITISSALSGIKSIRGVYHHWRVEEFPELSFSEKQQIGFIAQELEPVYPQLVTTDKNGYKSVDYSRLTPILLEAIKELDSLMTIQNQKISELKTENESIKKEVNSILDRLQMKPTGKTSQLLSEIK